MRWGRGGMLPPFFTPVPAAAGLPGQTGAGPQPWQGCSAGYSSTQLPRSPSSPNPSGKHSTPFLGNPKHDPVCLGLGEPNADCTQAKTQRAATAEVNLFPQMALELQSLFFSRPRDVAFMFNAREVFQSRRPTAGLEPEFC